jgi:hypothetical protein
MRYVINIAVAFLTGLLSTTMGAQPIYWPGPAVNGSWFDASRNGEGVTLQYLDNGKAILTWFTYPAADAPADEQQAWIISDLGTAEGNKLKFPITFKPRGGAFGDAFDSSRVVNERWGTIELEFRDCNNATFRYSGPPSFGAAERQFVRLSNVDQVSCAQTKALTASGARALSGLKSKSGLWYVPSRSGEGWMVEELIDDRVLVYWFTYDPQGRQAWTIGIGTRNGDRVDITENNITRGTRFGAAFSTSAVQVSNWGALSFQFTACNTATVTYSSSVPGYGSGTRQAVRLASIASAPCIDGTPAAKTRGTWVEEAAPPAPAQSESASTVLDGRLYVIGGFGDLDGFKRFDPTTSVWTVLPRLPSGRDHLSTFAIDGGIFAVGGIPHGDNLNPSPMYRFDVARNEWEARPEYTSFTSGSQAAVLSGRAYVGAPDGSLQEYDPGQRAVRRIAPPDTRRRDHAQVVAFLGEIWVIAGRSPETNSVAIYDPVREQWRAGPPINRGRGGFAAAVVDNQLVIGGGEVVFGTVRLEPTTEVIAAGESVWRLGPNLALGVHGVPGAALNGRFYVIGGSTAAGSELGAVSRMFSIRFEP